MTRHDSSAHDAASPRRPASSASPTTATSPWRQALPVLTGRLATLRELEAGDAPALRAVLSAADVARFISPAPASVDGIERFIEWMQHCRRQGTYVCFAVVPHGETTAAGLFQLRALEPDFSIAEWGFVLGPAYWGTGLFIDAATHVVDFAFATLDVRRLEARAAQMNGRGNGALRKLGAVPEAVLRRAFAHGGAYLDQVLWSIVSSEWQRAQRAVEAALPVH